MRLLLDTHTLLWYAMGDQRIGHKAKSLIDDLDNEAYISIAALWEIAIKYSIGKLELPQPFEPYIAWLLEQIQVEVLSISLQDINIVSKLQLHHRDPFDRIMVAQAYNQELLFLSRDSKVDQYDIQVIW